MFGVDSPIGNYTIQELPKLSAFMAATHKPSGLQDGPGPLHVIEALRRMADSAGVLATSLDAALVVRVSEMTPQQVFDRVVEHLATQGRASRADSVCLYRGPGGISCAAGCLIPDAEYRPFFEDLTAGALTWSGLSKEAVCVVGDLQLIHDNTWSRRQVRDGLLDFARAKAFDTSIVVRAMPDSWCEGTW